MLITAPEVPDIAYELPWDGRPLTGDVLAFDTETQWVEDEDVRNIPKLALATVSSLTRNVVLRPDQLPAFFAAHPASHFAAHNFSFDFWVVHDYLISEGLPVKWWWEIVDQSRVHDTMLLDQLVRIARGDSYHHRNLSEVAAEWAGMGVDKTDPYRRRFGELIGRETEWSNADPGFFRYACRDTAATLRAYLALAREAVRQAERAGLGPRWQQELWPEFGVLTEQIQVKSSIALAMASRVGFGIDHGEIAKVEAQLAEVIETCIVELRQHWPQLFFYTKSCGTARQVIRVKNSKAPKKNLKELREILASRPGLDAALEDRPKMGGQLPRTNTGKLQTALDVWRELLPQDPFVQLWSKLEDTCKTYQFVVKMKAERPSFGLFDTADEIQEMRTRPEWRLRVQPRINTLVSTGRTSYNSPNLQQMPREGWFRAMFIPSPGCKFIVADYSAIELVTLAAVCLKRFGRSRLAEVFREGHDPHAYTAAILTGLATTTTPMSEVMQRWNQYAQQKPKDAKLARQSAKAFNFGIPGGLVGAGLVYYAKTSYGVDLTDEQAADLHTQLTTVVYPELGLYLTEDPFAVFARNCGTSLDAVWRVFQNDEGERPRWLPVCCRKVIGGNAYKRDGTPYKAEFIDKLWDGMLPFILKSELPAEWKRAAYARQGSFELRDMLFGDRAVTLTGRVKSGLSFTEARNLPFQGLAADGGKLALWALVRGALDDLHQGGFRIAAFVHDEIVIEHPADDAARAAEIVQQVMRQEMGRVLRCDLPVKVACEISDRWEKP